MSLRKSSKSRNGSKSDVFPKPNARRKCTPAPSMVGLALMSRFTGRIDMSFEPPFVRKYSAAFSGSFGKLVLKVVRMFSVRDLDRHVAGQAYKFTSRGIRHYSHALLRRA